MTRPILLMLAFVAAAGVSRAQSLDVAGRATSRTFMATQLLADKAARDIEIADPVYERAMAYRAIAMADLLRDLETGSDDYVQARAVDDFSVAIPAALLKKDAVLAIETAAAPWPKLPGGTASAGPFCIVWQGRPGAGISSEYWAYRLAALTVPAVDPVRRGLDRFVAVCTPATASPVRARERRGPTSRGRWTRSSTFSRRPAEIPARPQIGARLGRADDARLHRGKPARLRNRRHRGMAGLQSRKTLRSRRFADGAC